MEFFSTLSTVVSFLSRRHWRNITKERGFLQFLMGWGQQCGCEAPHRACPCQRPSAPLWLYSLGLVITFPQSSPHGNQTLGSLQTSPCQPKSHTLICGPTGFFFTTLGSPDALMASAQARRHPAPPRTPVFLVADHLFPCLLTTGHLVFAQQLQASSGLAKAVRFSTIQGPNHPFSHEFCIPSMSFFRCSPSARGYQVEFPFSYGFFLIKNNNSYIKLLLFTYCVVSLSWMNPGRYRGHGKTKECPPWSYEQVDKKGDRKGNKGGELWGRRGCRQRELVIFLLLSPESGS